MLEVEALQRELSRGHTPIQVPTRILEHAFYLPIDEDLRELLGDNPNAPRSEWLMKTDTY